MPDTFYLLVGHAVDVQRFVRDNKLNPRDYCHVTTPDKVRGLRNAGKELKLVHLSTYSDSKSVWDTYSEAKLILGV